MDAQTLPNLLSGPYFWLIVASMCIGNFCMRGIFIFALDRVEITENVRLILKYIPASVLAALVLPSILLSHGQSEFAAPASAMAFLNGHERIIAGLLAVAVALWKRSMLITILTGMIALYLLQMIFG